MSDILRIKNSNNEWESVLAIKGDKGDRGDTGAKGNNATISIGTVTSGTVASVTNIGTSTNAVLNFSIPKGEQGASGVHVGTTQPTNNANVWINPSGNATEAIATKVRNAEAAITSLETEMRTNATSYFNRVSAAMEEASTRINEEKNAAIAAIPSGNQIVDMNRSLNALWRINKGQTYDYEEVSADSYSDTVISGGRIADVHKLGGKSVVWNYYLNESGNVATTSTVNGITFTNNNNGTWTINGTATARANYNIIRTYQNVIPNHKYYIGGKKSDINFVILWRNASGSYISDTSSVKVNAISTALSNAEKITFEIVVASGTTVSNVNVCPILADLTQMYGSGNEPTTTTDERIKAIESYASSHSAYNSGELISAKVTSVKSVGKNIWSYNGVKENATSSTWYDLNGVAFEDSIGVNAHITLKQGKTYSFIVGNVLNVSSDLQLLKFTSSSTIDLVKTVNATSGRYTTYTPSADVDIYPRAKAQSSGKMIFELCIIEGNATTFVPYAENTTTVPTTLTSIDLHSAGSVYDYFDFTEMLCHKKVGVVDLGSLTWTYEPNYTFFFANPSGMLSTSGATELLCGKFAFGGRGATSTVRDGADNTIYSYNESVRIKDTSYTDATAFKTAMNGVLLYYELSAEQTTLINDDIPYFDCEGNGTITFIQQSTELPIPHTTEYTVALGEVQ